MADQTITIPGNQGPSLDEYDWLTIIYGSDCRFCITKGDQGAFNPPLPHNVDHRGGDRWRGQAVVANATIQYSTCDYGHDCGSKKPTLGIPGSIIIGSGQEGPRSR
jgi:hypothetical protein